VACLPGWQPGPRSPRPHRRLSLAELDGAIGRFLVEDYNQRPYSEIKAPPVRRWAAGGWLPRTPESLEHLDMLLLSVARPRVVHRDGIRFAGQRYPALTLAGYVGEAVTIRYDPRDLAEIGVYHDDRFVCRAVSPELAAQTISLQELQATRSARRRALARQLAGRREHAEQLLAAAPYPHDRVDPAPPPADAPRTRRRLALYREQ